MPPLSTAAVPQRGRFVRLQGVGGGGTRREPVGTVAVVAQGCEPVCSKTTINPSQATSTVHVLKAPAAGQSHTNQDPG